MVEGARLERVYTGNRIEGSNPSLSATCFRGIFLFLCELEIFPMFSRVTLAGCSPPEARESQNWSLRADIL